MAKQAESVEVADYCISSLDWDQALSLVESWAARHESRYVCMCNTHVVMTARSDVRHDRAIRDADLRLPDGMPIAVLVGLATRRRQSRLSGPDFMWRYCARAERVGQTIFLLGATAKTLERLSLRLLQAFPALKVAGYYAPPFRPLSAEEDGQVIQLVRESRAHAVFVALGCPKQEIWMREHRGLINAVMLGVGAAFDFHAGVVPRAPVWVQNAGMEWLHRLITEPRRLWRRYLSTNVRFLLLMAWRAAFQKRPARG